MGYVIKISGKKEAFSSRKIRRSVKKSAGGAYLPKNKIKRLLKEIAEPVINLYKNKKFVKTKQLRRSILGRLNKKSKATAAAWIRYEKTKRQQ